MEKKCCKNPACKNFIVPIRRRNNLSGNSLYCSRKCYHEFSPGMVKVYETLIRLKGVKETPEDPHEFMASSLREIYRRFPTWTARACALGIKRQSFARWCKVWAPELLKEKQL